MPVLTEEEKRHGVIVPPRGPVGFDGGGRPQEPRSNFPVSKGEIGMWLLLTAIAMLFAGMTSAYVVLRGVPTWQNIALPQLLWLNTLVLIASSVTLEASRRAVKRGRTVASRTWLWASGALGLSFLAGQLVVWRELVHAGVYLPTTLQSSFFYVLTGLHGVHLLGGVGGLAAVLVFSQRGQLTPRNHEPLRICALYWHSMDVIWIYLFLLLFMA